LQFPCGATQFDLDMVKYKYTVNRYLEMFKIDKPHLAVNTCWEIEIGQARNVKYLILIQNFIFRYSLLNVLSFSANAHYSIIFAYRFNLKHNDKIIVHCFHNLENRYSEKYVAIQSVYPLILQSITINQSIRSIINKNKYISWTGSHCWIDILQCI